jgi:hypothetical protein
MYRKEEFIKTLATAGEDLGFPLYRSNEGRLFGLPLVSWQQQRAVGVPTHILAVTGDDFVSVPYPSKGRI